MAVSINKPLKAKYNDKPLTGSVYLDALLRDRGVRDVDPENLSLSPTPSLPETLNVCEQYLAPYERLRKRHWLNSQAFAS